MRLGCRKAQIRRCVGFDLRSFRPVFEQKHLYGYVWLCVKFWGCEGFFQNVLKSGFMCVKRMFGVVWHLTSILWGELVSLDASHRFYGILEEFRRVSEFVFNFENCYYTVLELLFEHVRLLGKREIPTFRNYTRIPRLARSNWNRVEYRFQKFYTNSASRVWKLSS